MSAEDSMNITNEVNMVWSIANKLRGLYKADKYKDVIIPMTIIRRFECALAKTKKKVLDEYEKYPDSASDTLERKSGYKFYNTSKFDLKELLNDANNIKENFKSYIAGFSPNVKSIIDNLDFEKEIDKMYKGNRLLSVIKAFSAIDLDPDRINNIKMGYIFEDIIRRFSENAEAGDHYTPREVIKLMVNILLAEGCDDLFTQKGKVTTVLDFACGTGGMLSTVNESINKYNDGAKIELFGQEINPESYSICLADMLIKGQNANHIVLENTLKKDAFEDTEMDFVIANPPFGQAWGGKDAEDGLEKSVNDEYLKGKDGRFGAGVPGTGDSQLLFMQHAISKMDSHKGRAAIITNGSPLFSGGTTSGESQIRKMMIDEDLIEAIIGLPTDLFYNTNIGIYVFILSKNKDIKRKGKIQLIDATGDRFWTPLRKSLGKKRKEISNRQIDEITKIYAEYKENEFSKIINKDDFKYKEYSVYQPLQRDYAICKERINDMINNKDLSSFYDKDAIEEIMLMDPIPEKEKKKLDKYISNETMYNLIIKNLNDNISEKIYYDEKEFLPIIKTILKGVDKSIVEKVMDSLSRMNKNAVIHKDKKGNIIFDPSTKDTEIIKFTDNVDEYMKQEVLPHIPDAQWVFEENTNAKKPVIKTGAEFPYTRYFYKYNEPEKADKLLEEFLNIEKDLSLRINSLVKED